MSAHTPGQQCDVELGRICSLHRAAPDLLKEAERVLPYIDAPDDIVAPLRAAIAKARGER